jgi:diguanylate cyclase (GGDEF)-like protein
MPDPSLEPSGFRSFSAFLLRIGPWRSTLLLTAVVFVLSLAIAQLVISVIGHGNRWLAALSAALCSLLITPVIGACILSLVSRLEQARAQLAVFATQDSLTGVHNRRHFMVLADREWSRCRRYGTEAAMLLIDADHFKRINDTYGHLAGDALLREMARAAGTSLRQADILARFGGEELIVFLPHTDPLGALDVAERIREHVAALRLDREGQALSTTVSIGVAALGADHVTLDALIHDADVALYAAKDAGRNCVRAAPIQPRRSGETTPVISR